MHLNDILKAAVERRASDLHLKVGSHPVIRVDGRLQAMLDMRRLQPEDTIACAFSILSSRQKEKFKTALEIDIAYSVPGLGRFRVNAFQQRGSVGLVLRLIPHRVLTFGELRLPAALEQICEEKRGMILCAGATGAGKSTTLAAMIEYINSTRCEHVVTIEDPIEFLHRDKKSLINQREVDVDTTGVAPALRSALRQDPDVILVGEMRDAETIDIALAAAETGHLLLSSLHVADSAETVNRIVNAFAPHQQRQVRLQLASVLRAVISLRLVPRADGQGRVPAVEVLRSTPYVRECIENRDKTRHLNEAIASGGSQYGMQTFDQSLFQLMSEGLITREEALRRASNADEFRLRLSGVQTAADETAEMGQRRPPPAAPPQPPQPPAGPASPRPGEKPFDLGNNF